MKALEDVLRPLMRDARLSAGGFPVAGLADAHAVEGDAGVPHAQAGAALMFALIVDKLAMAPEVVGARKGFVAGGAGEGPSGAMHGERVSEEVVGARKGLGALLALVGPLAAMLGEEVALEVILPAGLIGTLWTLHAGVYL